MKFTNPETVHRTANRQSEPDRRCAMFQELCRTRGIRVTAQRLAVYRVLAEDMTHPTADSIRTRLRRRMPSLATATVYRVLEFLEKEGLVRRVSTTAGVIRFDSNTSRHQHLICRSCGLIADYEPALPSGLRLPGRATGGFVAEEYDVRVIGLCRKCLASSHATRRPGKP